ncbi:MAG TPA: methyltransferase [Clostridiaceae bacterium]|nr:methyltransferase [Clostridiaceae bacterium]
MTQSHYFNPDQNLDNEIKIIDYTIDRRNFSFITDRGVFSRNKVDYGTNVMLKTVLRESRDNDSDISGLNNYVKHDKVQETFTEQIEDKAMKCLDLGCGYGAVSIVLNTIFPEQKWYATDINPRAVELTKRNSKKFGLDITAIESDGIPESLTSSNGSGKRIKFDLVILNPPIRTGKDVYYRLFAEVAEVINDNGIFYTVIQKKQGAVSALKYLQSLFSDVIVADKSGGYHTIRCRTPIPD